MTIRRIDVGNGYFIDLENNILTIKNDIKIKPNPENPEKTKEEATIIGHYTTYDAAIKRLIKEKTKARIKGNINFDVFLEIYQETAKEVKQILANKPDYWTKEELKNFKKETL